MQTDRVPWQHVKLILRGGTESQNQRAGVCQVDTLKKDVLSRAVSFGMSSEWQTPVLWPPHVKSWLIGKDSDAGRDWGQEEKGMTKDEMAGWHHWLDGHESEWTPGVGDGQGGLVYCDSWARKESDTTERLKWTELNGSRCGVYLRGECVCACTSHARDEVKFSWEQSWVSKWYNPTFV